LIANKFDKNEEVAVDRAEINVKKELNSEYDLAFKFTSNDKKEENNSTVNDDVVDSKVTDLKKDIVIKNKDIIINNAFALADKKMKISLQDKWNNVTEYLTDNHYSMVVGKWTDVKLEVVGGNYIIFTAMYESIIDGIYLNEKLSNDFINMILDGKYNYVVITNNEWNKYRDEYIKNIQNGIKYELRALLEIKDEINEKKETTIVDRLFDIVGEENIEFK